jgi:hypothetical protein
MCIPEGTRMFMAALFVIIAKYWKKKPKLHIPFPSIDEE